MREELLVVCQRLPHEPPLANLLWEQKGRAWTARLDLMQVNGRIAFSGQPARGGIVGALERVSGKPYSLAHGGGQLPVQGNGVAGQEGTKPSDGATHPNGIIQNRGPDTQWSRLMWWAETEALLLTDGPKWLEGDA